MRHGEGREVRLACSKRVIRVRNSLFASFAALVLLELCSVPRGHPVPDGAATKNVQTFGTETLEAAPQGHPADSTTGTPKVGQQAILFLGVSLVSDTAFQVQYRQEFIAQFEQRQSLLRDSCTTEAVIKGNQAVFLVAGSGGATAVNRGINGLIPARADNLNQNTATLNEWHDLVRKTNFNVFASQGNQRAIMQQTSMGVINRKVDQDIIGALQTATVNTGAAQTASLMLITRAKTKLGNAGVPWDGNITFLITPAFEGYLEQLPEFANRQYVNKLPTEGDLLAWRDKPQAYWWKGSMWIVHPNLPGAGTNAAQCFCYHKSSIGHALDSAGLDTPVGYDEEQAYSWARASANMGTQVLQNSGIVIINHDDSQLS